MLTNNSAWIQIVLVLSQTATKSVWEFSRPVRLYVFLYENVSNLIVRTPAKSCCLYQSKPTGANIRNIHRHTAYPCALFSLSLTFVHSPPPSQIELPVLAVVTHPGSLLPSRSALLVCAVCTCECTCECICVNVSGISRAHAVLEPEVCPDL